MKFTWRLAKAVLCDIFWSTYTYFKEQTSHLFEVGIYSGKQIEEKCRSKHVKPTFLWRVNKN